MKDEKKPIIVADSQANPRIFYIVHSFLRQIAYNERYKSSFVVVSTKANSSQIDHN